jgi:NAD(P)-dependent dehydrogenase (short-subunit alcohol dehydrogenase family)
LKIEMLSAAPAAFKANLAAENPQGRLGTVADLGDAVALFASESSRWISGQSVNVSGWTK